LAGGHRPVTVAVAAINLMWLLPIAIVVGLRRLPGFPAVLLAYAPLLVLALRLGAGRREDRVPAPASKE
jgi:Fuc2NAc and GlcNAc transferase